MRPVATGIWIPSEDQYGKPNIKGWRVKFLRADNSVIKTFTNFDEIPDSPYIIKSSWQLDGIGNTISATLDCLEHPYRDPYSFAARLEALTIDIHEVKTYHEIWQGFFKDVDPSSGTDGTGGLYVLNFLGLQEKIIHNYWHGVSGREGRSSYLTTTLSTDFDKVGDNSLPPTITSLRVNQSFNLSNIPLPDIAKPLLRDPTTGKVTTNLLVKVSDVISKALEPYTDVTWGIDANRRSVMGAPSNGTAVHIQAERVFDINATTHEFPPAVNVVRVNPGDGWKKADWSREAPEFTPFNAVDGPAPQKVDKVTGSGMPFGVFGVDIYDLHFKLDLNNNKVPAVDIDGNPILDINGNPVYVQEPNLKDPPSRVVTKGYAIYAQADPQNWYEASALIPTNNSTYEPQTAIFTMGINLERLPIYAEAGPSGGDPLYYTLVVDWTYWISQSADPDLTAVGRMLEDDNGVIVEPSPIHPRQSPKTIEILAAGPNLASGRLRLYNEDVGLKGKPTEDITIDPSYFTQAHPEFAAAGWGDRFYIHIAMSAFIEKPDIPLLTGQSEKIYTPTEISAKLDKADFTFIHYERFGQKVSETVDVTADVQGTNYPYFVGPAYDGWVDGLLCTPAYIEGSYIPTTSKRSTEVTPVYVNQFVAGVQGTMEANTIKSSIKTGILPFPKDAQSQAYPQRRKV